MNWVVSQLTHPNNFCLRNGTPPPPHATCIFPKPALEGCEKPQNSFREDAGEVQLHKWKFLCWWNELLGYYPPDVQLKNKKTGKDNFS